MNNVVYKSVLEQLPDLLINLRKIGAEFAYQNRYIGEAISYLTLLQDILQSYQSDEI